MSVEIEGLAEIAWINYIEENKFDGACTDGAMSLAAIHNVSPIVGAILLNSVTETENEV